MVMESNGKTTPHKGKQVASKKDPAVHRYSISLVLSKMHDSFLSTKLHMDVMAHFITACIFQKELRT
jgi:hypothetical protein